MLTSMLIGFMLTFVAPASAGNCGSFSPLTGTCSVSNSGGGIQIQASTTTGGAAALAPAVPGPGPRNSGRSGVGGPVASTPVDSAPVDKWARFGQAGCTETFFSTTGCYRVPTEPEEPAGVPAVPPTVTLTDLATFIPTPATITGEPVGFGLVGGATNVIARASTHTQTGTILGWPVTVTFTPSSYTFSYGDGTVKTTSTGGTTWNSLGVAQFTPTDTTHIYRDRGTYTVTSTVNYTAAVTFTNGSTQYVPGHVPSPASSYPIRVLEAHTYLVNKTCAENPTGPDC